ncbi:hypothetical protein [Frateuria sp. STR12]|uniref:hypothetical protein n=1 Tax=Frateuria hangzhouensis TaxID=2995589 RepID=UPI00226101F4|nr:hypothetical protein [Frateuria sp. STR12]MCX7513800.1 hypothetical protein [Frateuria sp. STR12]
MEKALPVSPIRGKGSAAKRGVCSALLFLWFLGALPVAFICVGSFGWDHRFGHPPYGIWAFTAVYVLFGWAFFRGSHRTAAMFTPNVARLKEAGFEPELELVNAECYAGFARAQDRIIVLDNVHNTATELPLSDIDKVNIHRKANGDGWSAVDLLTRRLDLPRVRLKVRPAHIEDWHARLRIVLDLA